MEEQKKLLDKCDFGCAGNSTALKQPLKFKHLDCYQDIKKEQDFQPD